MIVASASVSGIVPMYTESLFKQIDEKKAAGAKENFEVGHSLGLMLARAFPWLGNLFSPDYSKKNLTPHEYL